MAFPPHVSPASLKRDHIDVLIPYVGPLYISIYISMCVNALFVHVSILCECGQMNSMCCPPPTKYHCYFKSDTTLCHVQLSFICASVCLSVCLYRGVATGYSPV